jgi:chromosome segregation ATPase
MPPSLKSTPSGETSLIVALMESIDGLRADLRIQTETINKKLDAQTDDNKEIVKKIDANASDARREFSEIRSEMADMKARLAEGSERMKNLRRDVDGIVTKCAVQHPSTTALQRKTDETDKVSKKKSMPWWLPLLVGGALAFVGEKAARFVINGLADPPAQVAKP